MGKDLGLLLCVSRRAAIRDEVVQLISCLLAARHLNFYRVHLLVFTLVPLVVSAIFWASNGPSEENQIAYIDALFMVTSAMTVTGLNSVEFQRITLWQQVILFVSNCPPSAQVRHDEADKLSRRASQIMMSIGAPSFVSIVVILIRRYVGISLATQATCSPDSARFAQAILPQQVRVHDHP